MTDEEINIAIAECHGWKDCHVSESWGAVVIGTLGLVGGSDYSKIPNYCRDLNAMHEAEKVLKGYEQISRYMWELERLTFWKPAYDIGGDGKQYIRPAAYYCTTHAIARHRAEAFLRTLGKWVEA